MPKIICFNGPPYCGKDTAVKALWMAHETSTPLKFAGPLKAAVAAAFSLTAREQTFFFETPAKDVAVDRFFGKTPREVLISFSEEWAKPLFGEDVFGRWAAQRIEGELRRFDTILVSDCGFQSEFDVMVETFGVSSVLLAEIQRPGCSFTNDSRGAIDPRGAFHVVLHNVGTLGEFEAQVHGVAQWFMGR